MPIVTPVAPNPSVLIWARQESGFEVDVVAKRLGVNPERLNEWETGDKVPTMRQLEHLAKFYHRPLGLFFRTKPPVIPPLATEYRRLNGLVPGHESPELRLAIRKMSNRRQLMIDLLDELGEEAASFDLKAHLNESPANVAERLRKALRVSLETQFKWASEWEAWASWRDAAEKLGVLVFQFPKVPLEEARGISLLSWPFPVAAVNSKEMSPEARSFTLIHEIVHLMLAVGHDELPAAKERRHDADWEIVERFAEETASHVLVSENALGAMISSSKLTTGDWDISNVRALARKFRVTPLAMATRLRASGFISWPSYNRWKQQWQAYVAELKPRSGGFSTPVGKTLGRAGKPFTRLILEAMTAQRITSDQAARQLDLKIEHFNKLKDALRSRPGTGGFDE
jgi:Zn-dependent peptidase ImmA (M78 family)